MCVYGEQNLAEEKGNAVHGIDVFFKERKFYTRLDFTFICKWACVLKNICDEFFFSFLDLILTISMLNFCLFEVK